MFNYWNFENIFKDKERKQSAVQKELKPSFGGAHLRLGWKDLEHKGSSSYTFRLISNTQK